MRRPVRALTLALLTLVLAAPATGLAGTPGTTLHVDDDGTAGAGSCAGTDPAPTSIQDAVDAVGPDSTILVCPGTYVGKVLVTGDKRRLTIRAVTPWTATLKPVTGDDDHLVEIDEVNGVTIQWLRLVFPTNAPGCARAESGIHIDDSYRVSIRGNRIRATGSNTIECGVRTGIYGDTMTGAVNFNLIQDPSDAGIYICGPDGPTTIRGNSIRYFHANIASTDPSGDGIEMSCNIAAGPVEIINNVVRGRASGGVTTPPLRRGLDIECCTVLIRGNRVSYARLGIDFYNSELPGRILRNVVQHDAEGSDFDTVGIEIDAANDSVVRGNRVTDFDYGVHAEENEGNLIDDNDLRGNAIADCFDNTVGPANTWTDNLALTSDPLSICPSAS